MDCRLKMLSFYKPNGVSYVSEPLQPQFPKSNYTTRFAFSYYCDYNKIMKKIIITIFHFAVSSFFISIPIAYSAANISDVIINEIAWMGTTTSANDEWIELYNNSGNPINFDGWLVKAEDGVPEIKLSGAISARNFYLMERTDDNSAANIAADFIYKGALGNSGENLKLYDNFGSLIDEVNCGSGWLAGIGKPEYKTMEKNNTGWQTSENAGGTPKSQNSAGAIKIKENPNNQIPMTDQTPSPNVQNTTTTTPQNSPEFATIPPLSPPPTSSSTPLFTPSPTPTYPDGIIFNEILPSPEGADSENEWIEIFNQNNFEVDISRWIIKDSEGTITIYPLPDGIKIPELGYLIIGRKESKITMNNDKDSLAFLQPDGKIADSIYYEKAPLGQSYNRNKNSWEWSGSLTPGVKNSIINSSAKTEVKSPTDGALSKQKAETAALAENLPASETSQYRNTKIENNLKAYIPVILIALSIAIFSGIAILFLKKKFTIEK